MEDSNSNSRRKIIDIDNYTVVGSFDKDETDEMVKKLEDEWSSVCVDNDGDICVSDDDDNHE